MLEGRVLVLNKSWLVVNIAPVRRALAMLFLGSARAVHPKEYTVYGFHDWVELSQDGLGGRYFHTPNVRIRVPEVVQLTMFNGFVRHEVRFSRQSVFERDGCVCQYCGKQFPKSQSTIDHVIPQSRGGGETWENLVVACVPCNLRKGNRTPDEAGMPLVRTPLKPVWAPQFGGKVPRDQMDSWNRFLDTRQWDIAAEKMA